MATKIEATGPVSRGDVFRLNPEDITLGKNSRVIPATDYKAKVTTKALSIIQNGQLQPARGHKDDTDHVVLDIGHTRYDAIKLIRQGFEAIDPTDGEKRFFHNPNQQLDVVIDKDIKTAEDSFVASIIENSQRDDTTDVQEALAQQELREVYKWSNSRIARAYGYDNSNRVGFLQQLLTLPQHVIDRVHEGTLALHSALELKKVPEGEAKDTLVAKIESGEPLTMSDVREVARAESSVAEEEGVASSKPKKTKTTESPKSGAGLSRSVRDFRKFNEELQDPSVVAADVVKDLFNVLQAWFEGTRQDRSLWNAIGEIKGKRTAKE